MAGLNDPFLLADDSMEPKEEPVVTVKAFKEDTDGDVPELRDDIDLIAVAVEELEISLRDLELLRASIHNQRGMSQSIALEAEALMPGFLKDECPVAYFSKHPSRTLLSYALEEIDDKKKGFFDKFKEFISEMFKKVVDWLKNLFARSDKALLSKENTALLKDAKKTTDTMLLSFDKEAHEAAQELEAAKQRAKEQAEQARQQADAAAKADAAQKTDAEAKRVRLANLNKLASILSNLNSADAVKQSSNEVLNQLLSKTPIVKKFMANLDQVDALLGTHEGSIAAVIVLLADFERAVENKDYGALVDIIHGDGFENVSKASEAHARALIEFKGASDDYAVTDYRETLKAFTDSRLQAAFASASQMLESDMADQKRLVAQMDDMTQKLYRMDLYTPDETAAAQAKEALGALRDFSKSVLVPATQRLAFSFSAISQMIKFLAGLNSLQENLKETVEANFRKRLQELAEKEGVPASLVAIALKAA